MNRLRYIRRSLRYYRSAHLWTVCGSLLCTAILVGALIVGDSVRYSLQRMASDRLGHTRYAASTGESMFRSALAAEMERRLGTTVAPVLQASGSAMARGGERRLSRVAVVGVDARFGEIGRVTDIYEGLEQGQAVVNRVLADQLDLAVGDRFLLRIESLTAMPRDAPLASSEEETRSGRYLVAAIVGRDGFGHFRLTNDQIPRSTAFVSLSALAEDLDLAGRANGLLVADRDPLPLSEGEVHQALASGWTLADAGLEWRSVQDGRSVELRSSRVFIEPDILEAARRSGLETQPILTYFVNAMRSSGGSTPYSFASAPGGPIVPLGTKDGEIIINSWLAEDLGAQVGDRLDLAYYVVQDRGRLEETTSPFRVRAIVPLAGVHADRDLMPDFPGLSDEAHCRDWEAGVPIDYDRIRQKDEDYWSDYRGTPKAFVTLAAAQRMWRNRFGSATAIRVPADQKEELERKLMADLSPARFGLAFRDVKADGQRASSQSVDFAQLFLGLGFFVILAALILTGLLFGFHVDSRMRETGLLLAVGFPRRAVRRAVLLEGAVLAAAGSVLGGVAGIGVNWGILAALETVWSGAVGAATLDVYVKPAAVALGAGIGALLAIGTVWLVVRKHTRQPITELQRGLSRVTPPSRRGRWPGAAAGILGLGIALAVAAFNPIETDRSQMAAYFGAGAALLVGGIGLTHWLVCSLATPRGAHGMGLLRIALQNLGRRRLRSLTVVGLLGCVLFLVFTVGANRKSAAVGAHHRDSGTGGFALYGRTSVPVIHDLNDHAVRQDYGLDSSDLVDVRFVQIRFKEGDDASCLNLSRASSPGLLGIDPRELADRNAFTFTQALPGVDSSNPWLALEGPEGSNVVPAVADMTVITWGLGKSVGDTLVYTDEQGRNFGVRLVGGIANSVFQGNLIVSETHLVSKYPSMSGYRLFLIDAPHDSLDAVSQAVSWALQDRGLELVRTDERLAAFNQVENTYLSIFLMLGGLGLILGSIGIGVVVSRNIQERRGELALLSAVGYSARLIQRLVRLEYLMLLVTGATIGVAAAFVATWPTMSTPGNEVPLLSIALLLVLVIANGAFWIQLAATLALRQRLLTALRSE